MRSFMQSIMAVVIVLLIVFIISNVAYIDLFKFTEPIVWILYAISLLLLIMAFVVYRQVDHLNKQSFTGDEEDEVEALKYKKFCDYNILSHISMVTSLLGLGLIVLTTASTLLAFSGVALIFLALMFQLFVSVLLQKVYPDRDLPNVSESNYAEKLLAVSDDGERFVMLQGLYKSFNLFNLLIIFAIIGAIIYSLYSDHSQIFSIVLMCLVLLLTNMRYYLSIRNH